MIKYILYKQNEKKKKKHKKKKKNLISINTNKQKHHNTQYICLTIFPFFNFFRNWW